MKNNGVIPQQYGNLFKRHRGQTEATKKALDIGSMGYFMGCRTGKTAASMDTVVEGMQFPCLIVCPLSVIATWENFLLAEGFRSDQICKLRPRAGKKVVTAQNLLNLEMFDIYLVNYESIEAMDALYYRSNWHTPEDLEFNLAYGTPLPKRSPSWLGMAEWSSIIADESYRISNPDAAITAYFLKRPEIKSQFKYCLTGAPASETPIQYASQFIWMFGEFFGHTCPMAYCHDFWYYDEDTFKWYIKNDRHLADITRLISEKCYVLTMQDLGLGCIPLYANRTVPMNDLQKDWMFWTETCGFYTNLDEEEIEMIPPVRQMFYQKIACGLSPITDENISNNKYEDTYLYWKDHQQPLLITSRFTASIHYGAEYLESKGMRVALITGATSVSNREKYRQMFQNGDLDAIVAQPRTIQMGLDFSNLGDIVCWSDERSSQVMQQLQDRGQRVDRSEPYQVITIFSETYRDIQIDEYVKKDLTRKEKKSKLLLKSSLVD